MKNLVKSLIIVLSCLVANVAWAENVVWDFSNTTEAQSFDNAKTYSFKATDGSTEMRYTAGSSDGLIAKTNSKDGYLKENGSTGGCSATDVDGTTPINKNRLIRLFVTGKGRLTITCNGTNGKYKVYDGNNSGSPLIDGYEANKTSDVIEITSSLIWIETSNKGYINKITWSPGEGGGEDDPGTDPQPSTGGYDEIIKVTLKGSKGAEREVTGSIGGTSEVNNLSSGSPYKLNSNGAYVSLVLKEGNYEATDTLILDGSKKMQVFYGPVPDGTYLLDTDGPTDGIIKAVLKNLPANQNSIYIYRSSDTYNGKLTYMAVHRPKQDTPEDPVTITSVTVEPNEATLDINDTKQLTATVVATPDNADNKKVTWKSSNEAVATVSESGLVKAIGAGTATITATSTKDETKQGTCAITVNEPAEIIEVTSIALNETEKTILIGGTLTLTVTYTPEDANTGKGITWSSSDATVAKVEGGVVTGLKEGDATIKATTENGKEATCAIKVEPVHVTSVTLDKETATIKEGATLTLTAKVLPENATNKDVKWSSNKETVATVDNNGKVTGIAEGEAIITVKTVDGEKTAECKVKVEAKTAPPATGLVAHTPEVYENNYGGSLVNGYEVYYINREENNLSVSISNVDREGNITTSSSQNATKAKDGWLTISASSSGNVENAGGAEEFQAGFRRFNMQVNDTMRLRVKGFDQFSIYAKDNSTNEGNNEKHFVVIIDGEEVSTPPYKNTFTIRRYGFDSSEHDIIVTAVGSSANQLTAFSLHVSNDPLVRQVAGPKEQTVYQTKEIEPTAYVVRRAAKSKLAWKDDKAAEGISMTEGTNDSVFVSGKVTAAAGTYTYIVQALDAEDKVAATETGTLTIETHVFDCERGNDFKAEVGEQIRPLSFKFYAANKEDITLNCDIEGLTLTKKDSIAVLEGTPSANTAEGEHTYSIKAAGGNTVSGTITVSIPDPYFEPIAEVIARINQQVTFALIARHAETVTVTGLPNGFTCKYDKATDKATITGTPTAEGEVPFTATATPRYQGKQTVTANGKLIVIGQNEKIMLVVHKDLESINDEPVAKLIKDTKGFYVTMRKQEELEGSSVEAFDFLFISENVDADHKAVQQLTKEGGKPMLNMKAFTYSPDRLNWGQPNNGTVDTVTHNGQNIFVERNDHPIFEGKQHGETITILSQIVQKGVMPITINSETLGGSYCLATAYTRDIKNYYKDGELQTFLHEIPAAVRGKKYICMPIALSSSKYLTDAGKNLVSKVVDYLMDEEPFTLPATELQINSFVVEGFEATIEANYTIELEIPANRFQELDSLKHAKPVIELEDPIYTHVSPESGEEVDLHYATFMPVVYEVTNYIKRQAYDVYVRIIGTQGIEGIYSVGEWVNIYDIFGRKVTTTNEDVYQMELPRGVYIVVTSEGQTLKIIR